MKKGRILRFMVVFLSGFLAITTSVYAAHFTAAGVESHITPETVVQLWFLGVSSRTSENSEHSEFMPVIPTQFQCTVVHKSASMSFWLFASAKEIDPFTVVTSGPPARIDTITITGTLLSHLVFVSKSDVQSFTETIPFKAVSVDVALPGEGQDTFDLEFEYSAKGIGPLLLEALGPDLVNCDEGKNICILKLADTVEKGEVEGHTASGD